MRKFKTGDLVKLNSGSPDMTIIDINEEGTVLCCWWNGTGDHTPGSEMWLPPEALTLINFAPNAVVN
jgi:uncharacterized protein YodC (DUF2158 family)